MKGCIIIPYRDREKHLNNFLENAPKKINVSLDIVVVEQSDTKLFNRAKLLNIGFCEKQNDYDYFIFHDVDMIPFKNVDYSYSEEICHLSRNVEQFNYKMPYETYLGGVLLFPKDKFLQVNGFSNDYWGWGQEDDNMYFRIISKNLKIVKRDIWYNSLKHKPNYVHETFLKNVEISNSFQKDPSIIDKEGLSSLVYKKVIEENKGSYILIKTEL